MAANTTYDESLYSRQIYALGKDVMQSIVQSNILISGMNGLGVEIAKNAMLNGYNSIVIHDIWVDDPIKEEKSTNYYAHKYPHIQRGKMSYLELKHLNPYVKLSLVHTNTYEEISYDNLSAIILADSPSLDTAIKMNNMCRSLNIKFIYASTYGLYGYIFCDFITHQVVNIDGEKPLEGIITKVEINEVNTIITTMGPKHHGLTTDTLIKITCNFPCKLKDTKNYTVKFMNRYQFSINFKSKSPQVYQPIGINSIKYIEIKPSTTIKFKSLEKSYKKPEFVITNFYDDPNELHTKQHTKSTSFAPVDYVIGSIASQEITKAISNNTMPIKQWLYFDARDLQPVDLINLRIFIVGAGAIGCELLKNFSMLNIASGPSGMIYITDMDTIEKSNLNRQFLFRNKDIGSLKSNVAASACQKFNKINITPQINKIGGDTDYIYDHQFYSNIDVVCNALDNVQTRLHVDSKCVLYRKPLIESGTLGTKGNVQVVIPGISESYGSTRDPQDEDIPVCTIKHFPTDISHCVQWARNLLEGLFTEPGNLEDIFTKVFTTDIEQLLEKYPTTNIEFWSGGKKYPTVITLDPTDELHANFIKYGTFIVDSEIKVFEKDDDTNGHIDFLNATTNIRAKQYGIEQLDKMAIKGLAGKIIPALSTTTSLIASLATIELLRLLTNKRNMNSFVNLAIPMIAQSEPLTLRPDKNFWNTVDIYEKDVSTLSQLIQKYENLDYVMYGSYMIYNEMTTTSATIDRKIMNLIADYYNININGDIIPLVLGMKDDSELYIRFFYD